MNSLQSLFKNIFNLISAIYQMSALAWQSQPSIFVGLTLLQVLQGLLPVGTAWVTKQLLDLLVPTSPRESIIALQQELLLLLAAQVVITLTSQMSLSINEFFSAELSRKLTLKTKSLVYDKISNLDGLAYFEDPKFHDTIRLASQGAEMGPVQILSVFTRLLTSVTTLISFLGILIFLSPVLAGIVAIASVPQLYVQLKMGQQRFSMTNVNSPKERRGFYFGQLLSSVHFIKEIRLFNLEHYFLKSFLHTIREVHQTQRLQQLREIRWQFGLGILASLIASAAFIGVILQAFTGRISLGEVIFYTSALSNVQGAFTGIILSLAHLNESMLFFTRFTDLIILPPALPIANPARSVPPLQKGIEFQNVSFRYSEAHPWVLQKLNLIFPKGKCLALVGLNGAGKTTLVKLLSRMYDPIEGRILWDGIDIREFEPKEFRQHMGAVFQDFTRYDLTAQENIGLGNVDEIHNLKKIRKAAVAADVDNVLENLPNGYQTVLSRWLAEDGRGVDLSGGQWQKVALARMFMRDADFLILDEPTASLDAQAEHEIFNNFLELVQGHTSLLISHRFSTVQIADLIAVIEEGKVTEYGSHAELLLSGKTYTKLYMMQANHYTHSFNSLS